MKQIPRDSSCGSFTVVGMRRDRGAPESIKGRIMWSARSRLDCAHDRRVVFVGIIPEGGYKRAFTPSVLMLGRKFIGRLGRYDRDAHRELVDMLDWVETKGFDVRTVDGDPTVHATLGAFSFEGVRRDRGPAEDTHESISWTARTEDVPTAMRSVSVHMSLEGKDRVNGEGVVHGEIDADCKFVGSLAECGGAAREVLIDKMGWNVDGGKSDIHPY